MPDLIKKSLCNVNKIKGLNFFNRRNTTQSSNEKIAWDLTLTSIRHISIVKTSEIEPQAILSIWKMFGAALVNNLSFLILFTLHREFSIKSGTDCSRVRENTTYALLYPFIITPHILCTVFAFLHVYGLMCLLAGSAFAHATVEVSRTFLTFFNHSRRALARFTVFFHRTQHVSRVFG